MALPALGAIQALTLVIQAVGEAVGEVAGNALKTCATISTGHSGQEPER